MRARTLPPRDPLPPASSSPAALGGRKHDTLAKASRLVTDLPTGALSPDAQHPVPANQDVMSQVEGGG